MAIYRTGQASMDANGYITGYGTKWKTALTLIRPGATIVFASNPVAYATISEIVSDTSLRAISSGGAVVPKGDYVILLHDSLTVDGLAQDVAETLRYYQGQETMYQEFVEFLKGFDLQRMEQLGEKASADAKAAEASANAAKASETNANASKNAAAGSATTASQKATEAANSAGAAKTSETNANASKTAAANSAAAAANSATTAGQHKDAAAASASAARTSEGNASSSKNAAAASASAAKTSETNAKASEASATASKNAAKTSEDNAAASKNAAASSASDAAGSATSASNSAATAKSEADRAADLAKQLDATNLMRKDANLSDVVNKATARASLGLGSAATKDVGANIGNVLGVGYFGFGTPGTNILANTESGFYGVDDSGTAWAPQAGSGIVCGYNPARRQQIFTGVSGNIFVRNLSGSDMNTPSSTIPWTQMQAVGTSDIDFKKDITELDTEIALANIDAMEFVSFRYKDDDSEAVRRGVIAQQVEKIDPQYVHSAEGVGKMTLDINPLLMDALAAIKALRARDEENKERIAKLEGEVEELKAMVAALIAK